MLELPSRKLLELLGRLGVVEARVAAMAHRARRLACGLPLFESVWVDALVQSRLLSRYQAVEISAGRGDLLRIGPYVIWQPLDWPFYAGSFRARHILTNDWVRLVLAKNSDARRGDCLRQLEALAARSATVRCRGAALVTAAGADGDRRWIVTPWVDGCSAAEWLIHNGRFPPEVVLEVARQVTASLADLEESGVCHGDLATQAAILCRDGEVVLLQPGLRATMCPEEGYVHAELAPEAYDCLAPERVTRGTPANTASDLYACGCMWWHMLTGRAPLLGGSSLAKLRSAQRAAIPEVRRFAPDTPPTLVTAISACTCREPNGRPESMGRLAAMLGPSTRSGRIALARAIVDYRRSGPNWLQSADVTQTSPATSLRLAVAAALLVAVAAIAIPVAQSHLGNAWANLREGRRRAATAVPLQPNGSVTADRTAKPVASAAANVSDVVLATAIEGSRSQDLVLTAGKPIMADSLVFRPGQHVCAARGQWPVVVIRSDAMRIAVEDVTFENIDFVWEPSDRARSAPASKAVLVRLDASRAEFRGCSFRSAPDAGGRPIAIRWTLPAMRSDPTLALPSGRVQWSNCVFRGIETGIDCQTSGATAVEITNTLYLGNGPMIRVNHCPASDETLVLAIVRLTLRESGPLLEYTYAETPEEMGRITIRANQCALVPAANVPLLLFRGRQSPDRLLENTQWTGQDSLIGSTTPIATWNTPDGAGKILDDSAVAIEGLVRSDVGFAGTVQSETSASRVIRWQVPLHSPDPPGVNPDTLYKGVPLPERK